MKPEVVVFDLGMVLIGWSPEAFYDRVIGQSARLRLFAEVDLYAMNLRIDNGDGFHAVVADCAAAHPEWATQIMLWHDRWPEMLTGPIAGSVALLRRLRAAGVPTLALTNFGRETLDIAQGMFDFLAEFDAMYVSGELRLLKPDAAIYAALEQGSGHAPGQLFFTDDRPENCDAATARGWHAHRFTGPEGLERALIAQALLKE